MLWMLGPFVFWVRLFKLFIYPLLLHSSKVLLFVRFQVFLMVWSAKKIERKDKRVMGFAKYQVFLLCTSPFIRFLLHFVVAEFRIMDALLSFNL